MVNQTNLEPQSYYKVVWKIVLGHNHPWFGKQTASFKETFLNKESAISKYNEVVKSVNVESAKLYHVKEEELEW